MKFIYLSTDSNMKLPQVLQNMDMLLIPFETGNIGDRYTKIWFYQTR